MKDKYKNIGRGIYLANSKAKASEEIPFGYPNAIMVMSSVHEAVKYVGGN